MSHNYSSEDSVGGVSFSESEQSGSAGANQSHEERLMEAERRAAEHLLGWQRAKADFQNYRKEEQTRVQMLVQFGNEQFVRELLTVLDSFELGLQAMKGVEAHEKGLLIIKGQFEEILKKHGVERISVKPGDPLNLTFHEPLIQIVSEFPVDSVAEEVSSGYVLYGKVIRPAKVSISKGP